MTLLHELGHAFDRIRRGISLVGDDGAPCAAMLAFIFAGCLTQASAQDRKAVDICDVLANLEALNGKEIVVRGEEVYTEHGEWLVAVQPCPKM